MPRFMLRATVALALAGTWPAAASAQAFSNPDKAPTNPTADDASVGIATSPATTASTPVPLKPDAARKEGAGGYVPNANVPAKDKR